MKKIFSILALLFLLAPATTLASQTMADDVVSVKAPVMENLYAAGRQINVIANIGGELVGATGAANIESDIKGDLIMAGGTISVASNIGGNARLAGGTIIINGTINGDLLVFAGTVELGKNSVVTGDVIVYGGNVDLAGSINGSLKGAIGFLKLRGTIGKNVEIMVDDALIYDGSKVVGNFTYSSSKKIAFPNGAVGGTIKMNPVQVKWQDKQVGYFSAGFFVSKLIGLLMAAVVALILLFVAPLEFSKLNSAVTKSFWKNMGIGFVIAIVSPIALILIAITFFGIPVALILGALLLISCYLVKIFAGYFVGILILRKEPNAKWKVFLVTLLGMFVIFVASLIPVVGWLAVAGVYLATFGAFMTRRLEVYKAKSKV